MNNYYNGGRMEVEMGYPPPPYPNLGMGIPGYRYNGVFNTQQWNPYPVPANFQTANPPMFATTKPATAFNCVPACHGLTPQYMQIYYATPPPPPGGQEPATPPPSPPPPPAKEPAPAPAAAPAPPTFVDVNGPFWLACLVIWFCNPLFGFIAIFLAISSSSTLAEGDTAGARSLAHASYGVSVAGVIVAVAFVVIGVIVWH